jgi:hypothetical protein
MDATAYLGDLFANPGVKKTVAVSAQNLDETQAYVEIHQEPVWLSWPDDAIVLLNVD